MSVLEHRALRQFLAVAEAGTVRAAARTLNMSQPPLTAAIQHLEARLEVRLFERSVKGMRLTQAGAALAAEARAVLGRLERAEARVRAIGGQPGPYRIGFVSAALNSALPNLLRGLKAERRPAPSLFEMTTPEQADALNDGRIDVALLHPPTPLPADFESIALGRDPFWAALPADHRLARRKALRFADIAGEPFVLFPEAQGPVLYDRIRGLAIETAGDFRLAAETRRIHSQLAIVSGGLGVGLITRSTASALSFDGAVAVRIEDTEDTLYLELDLVAEAGSARALADLAGAAPTGRAVRERRSDRRSPPARA